MANNKWLFELLFPTRKFRKWKYFKNIRNYRLNNNDEFDINSRCTTTNAIVAVMSEPLRLSYNFINNRSTFKRVIRQLLRVLTFGASVITITSAFTLHGRRTVLIHFRSIIQQATIQGRFPGSFVIQFVYLL